MNVNIRFCGLLLVLLAVLTAPGPAVMAQTMTFHYGIIVGTSRESYRLKLVNPADGSSTIMPLTTPTGDYIIGQSVSPNGEWIGLIMEEPGTINRYFYLINTITGDTQLVIDHADFGHVAWSPNSDYVAMNIGDSLTPTGLFSTYVYSLATDELIFIKGVMT